MKTLSTIAVVLCLTACSIFSTKIQTKNIDDSVGIMALRHDGYVVVDNDLSTEQKTWALTESGDLQGLMREGEIEMEDFTALLMPVADRHDDYVEGDDTLSDLERRIYLGTTRELRKLTR